MEMLLQLVVLSLLSTSVAGWQIDWKIGENGLVMWDQNCDFTWFDIGEKPSLAEQCGGVCIANKHCTHFTWTEGRCLMKRNPDGISVYEARGAVCGYVTERINWGK
ncbi:uncharacterized protein LOC101240006 [Hydra vulgaris]|uniref:uncharacterized protein LOC101240006 n=1 Tax=Hydra vulgaris TaxID=6087 RepID=UPI0002B49A5F|nr:uncharacterized protein LOC101240006 [Hydra vulgaris]